MAVRCEMKAVSWLLWLTLLFLITETCPTQGESFKDSNPRQESNMSSGPLGLVVTATAPTVAVFLVATAGLVLALMFCVIRKMRRSEGRYQPRKEEQTGARSVETPDVLKLPKEERLI
ncbi:hypothetical protein JZ751_029532 [Albula glossodonta]|uniref:Uncharacterized protein n=1 Tax=Albula glossodonta TaxID=121402 RepID=A0A8T2NLI1_9TELE|nr:hypothetical protein JZ751_029532 [Albula glossodonta]